MGSLWCKMEDISDWYLCKDKMSQYWYWVKEILGEDEFILRFSYSPLTDHPDIIRVVSRTLNKHKHSILYKKFQKERISR